MRKTEREVHDFSQIEAMLLRAEYLQLALWDGQAPYIVPMNFGYKDGAIFVHGSFAGKRGECLRCCPKVAFSAVAAHTLVRKLGACGYTSHYQSVSGTGQARLIVDPAEKIRGLDVIMAHYDGPQGFYDEKVLGTTDVLRIDVERLTGKANPPGALPLDVGWGPKPQPGGSSLSPFSTKCPGHVLAPRPPHSTQLTSPNPAISPQSPCRWPRSPARCSACQRVDSISIFAATHS